LAKAIAAFQLPKDAIKKVDLGQSFAEYDIVRTDAHLFVETPALRAAVGREGAKSIFVGRRGSGKTATTYYLGARDEKNTLLILPGLFSSLDAYVDTVEVDNVHQRPFKTLVTSFKRSLLDQAIATWVKNGAFSFTSHNPFEEIQRERNLVEQHDFDTRSLELVDEGFALLQPGREREWNRFTQRSKKLMHEIITASSEPRRKLLILIDRIDED